MKIIKGDKVKIISGKDKGKTGEISRVFINKGKVLIEGINVVSRHIKKTKDKEGGMIKVSKPIDVSNVMLICPKTSKPTRVGYKIVDGKRYRYSKASKDVLK